jgi:hypothetical protein
MNPWHYASRQSYNTFKGNSFQKDAVEDKFGFVQFRPRFRSGNDAAGFGADCGSATTAAFFNQRFLNSMNEYNCKDFCILFKIHGKLPVAFGVRRHVAAFMVGNKLPTNAAGSKARACNIFPKNRVRPLTRRARRCDCFWFKSAQINSQRSAATCCRRWKATTCCRTPKPSPFFCAEEFSRAPNNPNGVSSSFA